MSESPTLSQALTKTIAKMLKPLVKLLIHKDINYIGIQSMLKETFVQVADTDETLRLNNKRQTDSRISLLTGVHRKEVKRIREKQSTGLSEKEIKASISAQIMAKWLGHKDYLDDDGEPKKLHKSHDTEANFNALVLSVSKDKHPRSILDDWLQQEIVTVDEEGFVYLQKSGYTASSDFEEKLFFAGKNIAEHLETVTDNLIDLNTPKFDRSIYYHLLSNESVKAIEKLANQEMLKALKKVNKKAAELQQLDADSNAENGHSIHLGAYFSKTKKQS